jgi:tetraacyldisaccharide 4'-kinase
MSAWWYIPFLLIPIILWGYGMFTGVKRWIYNGLNLRQAGSLPTLLVGNLSVGGSGKTPMVLFLLESFKHERIGVLSRGYGRTTKGFLPVGEASTYSEVGDEALEVFNAQKGTSVFVCEDRLEGLDRIRKEATVNWVVLDDGYQHVRLAASKQLLLTDYKRPFWKERFSLPLGNLREFKGASAEADVMVVTKCPADLSQDQAQTYLAGVDFDRERVFFAHYRQTKPVAIGNSSEERRALLVTGIVQKGGLDRSIQGWEIVGYLRYKDHYEFRDTDVHYWLKTCRDKLVNSLILTRKDLQRIQSNGLISLLLEEHINIYEIHTEVEILWNQKSDFLKHVHP